MKHVKTISRTPQKAEADLTIGQIIAVFAQILSVLGTALVAKDSA